MHLPMYYPITPLGCKWGFTRQIDMKLLLHYGAFDNHSLSTQVFFLRRQIPHVATGANGGDLTQ